jgi:tRNA threonylcarbamoyl adenosine modification protein YeaZ
MRYLYIDTSSSYLYSAIVEDQKLLTEVKEEYGQSLSEVTLPRIAEMFKKVNLEAKDIHKIIVVNGPGSFTGIRIGLTIAKVYAWSLNIPITTIYSLEAMSVSSPHNKIHVPMINARRGYVFAAIYSEKQEALLKPQHIKLEDLQKELKDIGEYEIITNDEFEDLEKVESYTPDFLKIVSYFKEKEPINPHAVNPEYLKLTEAEENKQ